MIETRTPPQSLDYERTVLGSMLVAYEALDTGLELLSPTDYYATAHRLIHGAIARLWERDEPVDAQTVAEELRAADRLDTVGGELYLAELMDTTATSTQIRHYCKCIRDRARLRQIITMCGEVATACYTPGTDSGALVDKAEARLFALSEDSVGGSRMERIGSIATRAMAEIRAASKSHRPLGLSTGLADLDRMTTGLHKGDLIYVAGRPGMGKTALLLHLAQQASRQAVPVPTAIYSLEMSKEQLAQRGMCRDSSVEMIQVRGGRLSPGDLNRLAMAADGLGNVPIWIDDTPGMTVMQIRSSARRLKARDGLGLILLDYMQLMQGTEHRQNRQEAIAEISRSLKMLAKELDVPVVALSQLSRAVEQRGGDKRPILSDLRESGAAEQDADLVIFLYREEVYNTKTEQKGVAELIVGKQRNGPTGTVNVQFNKRYMRFSDLSREPEYAERTSGRDGADW